MRHSDYGQTLDPKKEDNKARLATLFMVSTLTVMAPAAASPAVTGIYEAFQSAPGAELWSRLTLTIPPLFSAIGAMFAGQLIDRFGRRGPLMIALCAYGIAGSASGLAPDLFLLMTSRAVLGLAVAVIMVTAATLVTDYYSAEERRRILALQSGCMSLGGIAYFLMSGILVDIHWRLAFAIYAVALVLLPAVFLLINEPPWRAQQSEGEGKAELSGGDRAVWLLAAAALFGMVTFYMVPVQIPFYLQQIHPDISGTATGAALASTTLTNAFFSFFYMRVRAQLGILAVFSLIFALMASGSLILFAAQSYMVVIVGLVMMGSGVGLLFPHLSYSTSLVAIPAHRGRALGVVNSGIFFGQFLSPLAVHPLIGTFGLRGTFAAMAVLCALTAVLTLGTLLSRQLITNPD